jgi:hypothetical protein
MELYVSFHNARAVMLPYLTGFLQDIYLSATVLLAARLKPVVTLGAIHDSELQSSWHTALSILRSFQNDSIAAQRCMVTLTTLHSKLPLEGDAMLRPDKEHSSTQAMALAQQSENQDASLANSAARDSTKTSHAFSWSDQPIDFNSSDLSWLNVVPYDMFTSA